MALTKIDAQNIEDGSISSTQISNTIQISAKPKITNVSIANSTYEILDDTAVNIGGGYIVVTGSGFDSGSSIIIDDSPALSTTFVNSTTLRAQVDSANSGTYNIFVVNSDGSTGLKINALTYSGLPSWVTNSSLNNWSTGIANYITFNATGATSYSNTTTLPTGTTLLSNGYFYGTITDSSTTNYNFTIRATDAENQESDRTFSLTNIVITAPASVEYLIVAGGGSGGGHYGGGGGAGGFRTGTVSITSSTPYTVTVGSGGAAVSGYASPYAGANFGSTSSFAGITSAGGGGGGARGAAAPYQNGSSGGSGGGGGGGIGNTTGGSGNTPAVSPSQGTSGGPSTEDAGSSRGGGGGGASGSGALGTSPGTGAGGNGTASPLSGSSVTYAGGGGGGSQNVSGGTGGAGGGGNGGSGVGPSGSPGSVNTGGGGGGAGQSEAGSYSGAGGSGIVIIRYSNSYPDASATTGSPTYTNTGGYKIYKFTGSGSITW